MGNASPKVGQFAQVGVFEFFHVWKLVGDVEIGICRFSVELDGLRFIREINRPGQHQDIVCEFVNFAL